MLSFTENKDEIIKYLVSKGFLVSSDFFDKVKEEFDAEELCKKLESCNPKPFILSEKVFLSLKEKKDSEDNLNFEIISEEKEENRLLILKNYVEVNKKKEVMDFVDYFRARYNSLKNLLMNRPELQNATSINRILNKSDKDRVALIGIVRDKSTTKNGNLMITLEDLTGEIKVLVNKNKPELFESTKDILLDEVIGVLGANSEKIVFVNEILFPDVPVNNELKKLDREEYVVFTSDLHVGGKVFFENNFLKFISWLNGDYGGEEHKEIAKKVKYLFIGGDLVEGVGVYPNQDKDLIIQDIYDQYNKLTEYISKIRKDLKIITIGGNHDALRLSEPQPIVDKKIAPGLYELENVIFLTNPSMVNIFSRDGFPGFNILLYHGGSFPYISENVDSIRKNGRLDRPDLIMKYLLQRRHLAVSHTSTLYVPGNEDHLVIDRVPDFFISGHIHKTVVNNYRNVTLIGCGCWTDQTEDQEKRGIVPDPNRVILVNLQTREVKILNFED
ncbi:DNA-directed DNA polymerase II small subunit [Candidatus Woesearchaeota archaeon]|nr:DNA-directed DNA polymerase II small subunit [Candidatus Woesearchaeota archaeon]